MTSRTRRQSKHLPIVLAVFMLLTLILAACESGADEEPAEGSDDTAEDGSADIAEPGQEQLAHDELEDELGPVPEPSEEYEFGVVLKTLINEHWQEMEQGYLDAAEEHGVEVTVQAAEDEEDTTGQLNLTETMVGEGFDAYAVSPISDANLGAPLQQLQDQGVPVVNVDDARVDELARTFVGANHEEMGVLAAEELVDQLDEGAQVAQIEGAPGSFAAQQRIAGFDSVIEDSNFDYVASVPADWSRQEALDVMTDLLRSNPDLEGVYANNDTMALGAVEAVRNEDLLGEVLVIGTDGVPDAQRSIRDGEMHGTIAAFPYDMGTTAVEVMIRLLEGQPVPEWVVSRMELVTSDNIDEAFPE